MSCYGHSYKTSFPVLSAFFHIAVDGTFHLQTYVESMFNLLGKRDKNAPAPALSQQRRIAWSFSGWIFHLSLLSFLGVLDLN